MRNHFDRRQCLALRTFLKEEGHAVARGNAAISSSKEIGLNAGSLKQIFEVERRELEIRDRMRDSWQFPTCDD